MKRVVLLALLALALPTVALADSFDYGNVGGTVVTNSGVTTITSTLTSIKDITTNTFVAVGTNLGTVVFTTGVVSGNTWTGGSITITAVGGATLFSGAFTGGTIVSGGGITTYIGNLACFGCGSAQIVSVLLPGGLSGNTIVTPEPGTLGLLGTGLVGLAGIVRRKLRG
jgi:hypothetical protein